jgi:hypothetical protein
MKHLQKVRSQATDWITSDKPLQLASIEFFHNEPLMSVLKLAPLHQSALYIYLPTSRRAGVQKMRENYHVFVGLWIYRLE